jgi:cobalt-precorrin 5A hydrolase
VYISTVRVLGERGNRVVEEIGKVLEELGYTLVDSNEADAIISVYPLGITIRRAVKEGLIRNKLNDPVIISVTEDGSYIVPLIKEHWGGSFLANLIADVTGGQVILTSRTSQLGLLSVEELAWLNGLRVLNPELIKWVEVKLIRGSPLRVHTNGFPLKLYEGYVETENLEEADLVIDDKVVEGRLTLRPVRVAISLGYTTSVPLETLIWATRITLRSAFLRDDHFSLLVLPDLKREDYKVRKMSQLFGAETVFVDLKSMRGLSQSTPSAVAIRRLGVEGVCEPSLKVVGARIILKRTKRAKGVVTCLGVLDD